MTYEGRFRAGSLLWEGREGEEMGQRGEGWTGAGERDVIDSVVDRKGPQSGRGGRAPSTENKGAEEACSLKIA